MTIPKWSPTTPPPSSTLPTPPCITLMGETELKKRLLRVSLSLYPSLSLVFSVCLSVSHRVCLSPSPFNLTHEKSDQALKDYFMTKQYTHTFTCMHTHTRTHMHKHTRTLSLPLSLSLSHTHVRIHKHTHARNHAHIYVRTHTQTRTHAHTHTHTRARARLHATRTKILTLSTYLRSRYV